MSQLDAIAQAAEAAAQQAAEGVALGLAANGTIVDAPTDSLQGVVFAFEQFRRFWNTGAGEHHNRIAASADRLRSMK